MQPEPNDHRQAVALFRYGLIADLIHRPAGAPIAALLRQKATVVYDIPGSRRTRVAAETIRDWLSMYRNGGFDALLPKARADRGQPRRLPDEVAELLIATKQDDPALSVRRLIEAVRQSGSIRRDLPLPPSTVHRLLTREGLMRKHAGEPSALDRRRFAFQHAGEMFMSDVMHGPAIPDGRRRRKTYLIAFLDDATRVIPYAAFAFAETTAAFLPVFKHALVRRGIPQRLYVDNGANYRSRQLALICARLGIALIHARPYQPQGKGKIERWFRTVRAAFLTTIGDPEQQTLVALNRALQVYIEGEYHRAPHRGLNGRTPLEQWALFANDLRYPDAHTDLDDVFLAEARRRVNKDRTVSLNARVYEVDAVLVGQTVTLRYDPAAPPSRALEVVHDGKPTGSATPLDAYANTAVKRDRPSGHLQADTPAPEPAPSPIALSGLDQEQN